MAVLISSGVPPEAAALRVRVHDESAESERLEATLGDIDALDDGAVGFHVDGLNRVLEEHFEVNVLTVAADGPGIRPAGVGRRGARGSKADPDGLTGGAVVTEDVRGAVGAPRPPREVGGVGLEGDVVTEQAGTSKGKVAFLTADEGVERVELTEPWQAVEGAGFEPVLISSKGEGVDLFDHLTKVESQQADKAVADAVPADYAALVLPGGVANPDALRTDRDAVTFVTQFVDSGKPVAAICHAAWTLVEADRVRGRRVASWPSLQTDVRNAGGTWLDEEVVVDDNLISSRNPDDLPAFNRALLQALAD